MDGGTGAITKVAKKSGTKKARSQSDKQAKARDQLSKKVEENEKRLRSGLAADGQPLTPTQVENLREITDRQRERLESFVV